MYKKLINRHSIDVVLFDFGGVLAEEGFRNGLRSIAEENGINQDIFEKRGFEMIHETGYVLGHSEEEAFWKALREKTGISADNNILREAILCRFKLRHWLLKILPRLKESGLRLGILSDQTDWLDTLNERNCFYNLFDYIFNSFYLGKSKRDATLFDDIALKLKVLQKKILFVDDHPGNIGRAEKKGYHTILYINREGFLEEMEKYFPNMNEAEISC